MLKLECKKCNNYYFTYPSQVKWRGSNYCSNKCRYLDRIGKCLMSEAGKKRLSERMKKDNPMKRPENREKMSKRMKIAKILQREDIKIKIKIANTGRIKTIEERKKISARQLGEKNHNWQGGKSFEPYAMDWTKTLRRSIRERDKYLCQLCNKPQENRAHSIHHIDYDKQNCNPKNLITLCHKCHMKTNYNRDYWQQIIRTKL